ncbi:MAG: 30S ribosomal protein S10 [Candidatus Anstonellales archaeon]
MVDAKARIRLEAEKPESINYVIEQIRQIAKTLDMKIKGPIPMPRKKLLIATRRTPCGDGSDTYERWEKRISRRIIEIEGDEKNLRQILRIKVPDDVFVKIILG